MEYSEFRNLVAEMRKNQKEYFATRSKPALFASKNLEAKVDKAIIQLEGVQP